MVNKLKISKIIALRLLIAILFLIFGILIAAQLRSIPDRVANPISPYISLKQTKEDLHNEQYELKDEIKKLQKNISDAQQTASRTVLSEGQLVDLSHKKAQVGLTKLNGPGIILTLDDGKNKVVDENTIIHASDLRDAVDVLWANGAEGITINDQRIVITSAIDCIVNTILINNVRLSNPFRIEAIGRENQMSEAIANSYYLYGLRSRADKGEISLSLETNNDITLPVFDGSLELNKRSN